MWTSHMWLFGKYWFTELYSISKCGHIFLCNIKKLQSLISPPWYHLKILSVLGSCQANGVKYMFSCLYLIHENYINDINTFSFIFEGSTLWFITNAVSFSSRWQLHCPFWRTCLPNTQVWITIASLLVGLLNKNGALWMKWLVQLATHTNARVLFQETTIKLWWTSHFIT